MCVCVVGGGVGGVCVVCVYGVWGVYVWGELCGCVWCVCVCVYTYIPGRGFSLGTLMILAPNHYPQRPAWEPRE